MQPTLSVIVPCFNEEESLPECHRRLSAAATGFALPFEIVYVDDGSRDRTLLLLHELHASDPHVAVVELSRNFGHQAAVTAGLDAASGDVVAIIDADLQDPPEVIAEMLAKWREGYEVVYGVRAERAGESGFKLWTATAFYRLINRMSDVPIPVDTGDFRLLDRKAVDALRQLPERHRLLRGMCSWVGFRQYGLKYSRGARFAGTTKYPARKMLALAVDGITSFSTVPLRIVTGIGTGVAVLSFAGIVYTLFVRLFTHSWVPGWAMIFTGVLFIGGVQLISLGVVGAYVGRIYGEVKQRPLYLARNVLRSRTTAADLYAPATSLLAEDP